MGESADDNGRLALAFASASVLLILPRTVLRCVSLAAGLGLDSVVLDMVSGVNCEVPAYRQLTVRRSKLHFRCE